MKIDVEKKTGDFLPYHGPDHNCNHFIYLDSSEYRIYPSLFKTLV